MPPSFIEELLEHADIVAIIGDRVRLKRSGSNWLGLCPFHQEKGASFTVNPSRQFYHCFGCHAHGSVINFLMQFDNLTFLESVEKLASIVGLSMPLSTTHDRHEQQRRYRLFEINKSIANYFKRCLPHNSAAISYLNKRGVNQEICERFDIGYAPREWRFIAQRIGQDWSLNELYKLGLSSSERSFLPRFKSRIMFPIRDSQGRVLGFGGRTVVDDPAKYLNSPESDLYHKGECWYGMYEARPYDNQLMVVEGYLDVVSLAQYGVREVVASCGTAVGGAQLRLLTRRAKTVVFCFDGDSAGKQAAWRVIKVALPLAQDSVFQVVFLPQGEDPDSLIRKWGAEKFRTWSAAHRINLDELLLRTLVDKHDMHSVVGKHAFVQEVLEYLRLIPQGIFYQLMVKRINDLTQLDITELIKSGSLLKTANNAEIVRPNPKRECHPLVIHLLRLLVYHPTLGHEMLKEQELFAQFVGGQALNELTEWVVKFGTEKVSFGLILEHERDGLLESVLCDLMCTPIAVNSEGLKKEFLAIIKSMHNELDRNKISELIAKVDKQQLDAHEKLQLQTLIKQSKLGAMDER